MHYINDEFLESIAGSIGTGYTSGSGSAALGSVTYRGTWNALANTPILADSGVGGAKGDYYVVSVAGSTSIDGVTDWQVLDWIIHNGSTWEKVDNSESGLGSVTNVSIVTANGISGSVLNPTTTPAITLTLGAITPSSVASTGTVTGSNLSGTNTGDQTITLTSDVTGSGTGSFATTISANVVTNAKLSQVATQTIKGRVTAGLGNVEDLTASQVLSILGIGGARVIKSGTVLGGSFAGNPKTFAVVFGTAFSSVSYSILITSAVNRTWTYQTKLTTGFTINANANAVFAGEVSWFAISTGESIE